MQIQHPRWCSGLDGKVHPSHRRKVVCCWEWWPCIYGFPLLQQILCEDGAGLVIILYNCQSNNHINTSPVSLIHDNGGFQTQLGNYCIPSLAYEWQLVWMQVHSLYLMIVRILIRVCPRPDNNDLLFQVQHPSHCTTQSLQFDSGFQAKMGRQTPLIGAK